MGNTIELKITGMAYGGDGMGRYKERMIFIPGAIAGERVRAELTDERQHYARARLLKVLSPSPARVTPPCAAFGLDSCGGCQWEHIAYSVQALFKGLIVVDQFRRIGKFPEPPVLETIPDPSGWEYRNHAKLHFDAQGNYGFLAGDSHRIVPAESCLILHPRLNDLLAALEPPLPGLEWMEIRTGTATGDLMIVLQTDDDEQPSLEVDFPLSIVQVLHDDTIVPLIGLDYITEIFHEREFRISATSFYQVNTPQAERLIDLVLEALDLTGEERIVDAYCGMGLFTAFIAPKAASVVGIELNPDAIADARYNLNDMPNVEFRIGTVEDELATIPGPVDAVVLDPPREGLERPAMEALIAHQPQRIVYVSCDPATLARDARRLVDAGYTLEWVQPVDMFPQTYHIENVAVFDREDAEA